MLRLNRLEDARREAQVAEQLAPNAGVASRARTLLRLVEERQARAATRQRATVPVAARPDPQSSPDAPLG
jgi:hypothetical protein